MGLVLTSDTFVMWVTDLMWPFIRIGALFMAAPFFGAKMIPVRLRIVLALFLAVLLQPVLPPMPAIDPLTPAGALIAAQQVAIGVSMGMILQICFNALTLAGQTVATTMGLGFASAIDPQNGVQVAMVSTFYLIMANLLFLALDGHLILIDVLVQSFYALPIGSNALTAELFLQVVQFASHLFSAAVLIALPAMSGVLLVNLAFAVLTRAAPQMNIFSVGFPVTMLTGFILLYLSLPVLSPLVQGLLDTGFQTIRNLYN